MILATPVLAADILPSPESPPPPGNSGQPPAATPRLDVAPSPRDPGIVKQPDTVPHPDSVVHPPVVDPKMAINPEGPAPQPAEPSERRNEDQSQQKQ